MQNTEYCLKILF